MTSVGRSWGSRDSIQPVTCTINTDLKTCGQIWDFIIQFKEMSSILHASSYLIAIKNTYEEPL